MVAARELLEQDSPDASTCRNGDFMARCSEIHNGLKTNVALSSILYPPTSCNNICDHFCFMLSAEALNKKRIENHSVLATLFAAMGPYIITN